MNAATLTALLPVLVPAAGGLWILGAIAILQRRTLRVCAWLALLTLFMSGTFAAMLLREGGRRTILHGALVCDPQSLAFHLIFCTVAALSVLVSMAHLEAVHWPHGEFYALLLFAVSGMTIMASTESLLSIFLGLEILSIPLYVLAGFTRDRVYAIEAALKYFLLGAFATGFTLYGMALLYGASGRLDLGGVASALAAGQGTIDPLLMVGGALLLIGLSFKIAAVPFHFWAPDVYQGSLAPVAGFMATGTKAAAFATLLRVVTMTLDQPLARDRFVSVTTVIAILTMVVGNVVAIAQQNIKRMLAYSSIANAGYLLVALAAVVKSQARGGSLFFYLAVYGFMTVGAFAVAAVLGREGESDQGYALSAYAGLGRRRPMLAAAMTVFMLSLTGLPPAAGFMAKFTIFRDAVNADLVPLAAIALVTSVIGAFYYLRVVVQMYFREPAPAGSVPETRIAFTDAVAIAVAAAAILGIGLFPSALLDLARFAG
ncbi:MAG TPA: NADH-quinone oxidoreductase subunit N [Candidatus Polarisedimenticolia bacterium]|nr:NADH-quinone oxidoreductase subunit N [Candidatus Polarisedimenticolia bacterium]